MSTHASVPPGFSGAHAVAPSNSTVWTLLLGLAVLRVVAAGARGPAPRRRRAAPGSSAADARTGARAPVKGGHERGQGATSPADIPAKGWKDIALRVFEEFNKDRVLSVAAGVTFYGLLALFPAIAALVSCYGLVSDVGSINDHLSTLQGLLPGGAIDVIGEQVKRIAAKGGGTLGFAFLTSLAISLWSANSGMKAMFDALNIVYEEEEKRSFFWLNLRSLAFTGGALLFVVVALSGIVVLPVALKFVGIGDGANWVLSLMRWPVLIVVILGALALLYRYGPSRDEPQWRWVTPGGIVAATLWIVGSALFSWYVSSFGNYNETYGSLGAVIGFMTWIWLSTTIILLGGEINAEAEHQTGRDTTRGAERPMGARDARMADTVAAPA